MGSRYVALRVRSVRAIAPVTMALSVAVFLLADPAPVMSDQPSQPMSIPGKFDVGSNGAASYSIPIAVPPGTAGIAPALSFSFSSMGSNGIVGIGWSLSGLPAIMRCPRTIAQDGVRGGVNFDSNDRFCLDGQRLMVISGVYGADGAEYRTEIESFSRVISHGTAGTGPAWFEVHTKSGQIMQFGNTADSSVLAQGKSTARSWAVNKVSDTKGNYYSITYNNDTTNGQAYPIEIDYTGNAATGLAPYNSVKFVYAPRPDIVPTWQAGSLSQTTVRLTDVQTYAGTSLVTDYKLAYDSSVNYLSNLMSVTKCAADGSCLPSTSFTSTMGGGPTFNDVGFTYPNGWNFGSPPTVYYAPITGDFNGDGKADFAFAGQTAVYVSLSNGDGTFSQSTFNYPNGWSFLLTGDFHFAGNVATLITGDFNGDGKTDFAVATATDLFAFLSNGDGTFSTNDFTFPSGLNFGSPPSAGWTPVVGDFNGDGKADLAFVGGSTVYAFFSNGDGTFTVYGSNLSGNYGNPPTANWTPIIGDFNGDGKTDFLFVMGGTVNVFFSDGDGTFAVYGFNLGGNYGDPPSANWTPITGDFNGDGKTDFLFVTGGTVNVFLSKGDGTFGVSGFSLGLNYGDPPDATWAPIVGDFNGDGRTDFAFVTSGTAMVFLSNGDGTFVTSGFNPPFNFGSPPTANWTPIVGDFNGDGKTDFAFAGATFMQTLLSNGPPLYQLDMITSGLGATTTITYAPLTNGSVYTKDTNATYPMVDIQAPIYVVSRVDTSNGIGGTDSTTYHYAGAKADLSSRGFEGFRQVQSTDLQTGIIATSNFLQDYPYTGLTASETKTLNGATLSATNNTYGNTALGGTRYQVFLTQSQSTGADLDGLAMPTVTTSYQYDAYGNPTQIVVSTTDGHSKTTTTTYANDTVNWLLGRLTKATMMSQAPN